MLSQLDGQTTLGDIAEITGLGFDAAATMAASLLALGAVTVVAPRVRRRDPRAESVRPKALREEPPKARLASREEPPKARPTPRPGPATRRSRRSVQLQRPPASPPAADEVCELAGELQDRLLALDVTSLLDDPYARLGIDRAADRKTIKRAYFAYVSRHHPDRFFGKKLGPMRAVVERIFRAMTDAHDRLLDPAQRAAWDARLPPLPPARASKAPAARASRAPPAAGTSRSAPPRRASRATRSPSHELLKAMKAPPAPVIVAVVPPQSPTLSADRMKQLLAGARAARSHERAQLLVTAAEESLAKGDVIGASNNYRLALEHGDDPWIRARLDEVDHLARAVRHDREVARGRNAEREGQWADAALHYGRALDSRREASIAERAAYCLHRSGEDTGRALELAELAVQMRGGVADYRLTLAEILHAANKPARAREEAEKALALAPRDRRAKDLLARLAK